MAPYRRLCSISVWHDYFADGRCRAFDFVPADGASHLIGKAGLLARDTGDGVLIFIESSSVSALQQRISDPGEPSALVFKAFPKDHLFQYYTAPRVYREAAMLYFGVSHGPRPEQTPARLHAADFVSEQDFVQLDSPLLGGIIEKRDLLLKPAVIVSLPLAPALARLAADESAPDAAGDYLIRFKARETHWRYYLLGEMRKENAFIIDRHNVHAFDFAGEQRLADGRAALAFISRQAIPLREKSACFFQLKEKDSGKILAARLPAAAPNQFSKEVINGREAEVSDIYINC